MRSVSIAEVEVDDGVGVVDDGVMKAGFEMNSTRLGGRVSVGVP